MPSAVTYGRNDYEILIDSLVLQHDAVIKWVREEPYGPHYAHNIELLTRAKERIEFHMQIEQSLPITFLMGIHAKLKH